ncbi:MAG: C10 family peptidase [Desulfobacterales bacterium]
MKRIAAQLLRILLATTGILVFGTAVIFAAPTTPEQARTVVENWLALDATPLDASIGEHIKEVEVFRNDSETPLYYIVYLDPEGYVIVSADDLVEPVVGIIMQGEFDPSPENPLGALVSRDLPGRLDHVQKQLSAAQIQGQEFAAQGPLQVAQSKWNLLLSIKNYSLYEEAGVSSISEVRVSPFVQSRWGQKYEGNLPCYNYYTEWNDVHYPSGCVATAMAQLMRYYALPTAGVGTSPYTITVAGMSRSESLRGGDGIGGPYNWSLMELDPDASTGTTARRAIGALTHDAGLSVNMNFTISGSSADTLDAADVLIDTFDYSNAQRGFNSGNNIADVRLNMMLNPNLDAKYPAIIGVKGSEGGHAIVVDGYGYNLSTLYHHLNMGWNGRDDAWYNLPDIDSDLSSFTTVYKCVYNVYPSGTGEIISGRVLNLYGNPVA